MGSKLVGHTPTNSQEEENTFGVQRYPCMPSLVALQQMRNRLHLAFLGKKLMKWTALATGRELRRLASELYEVYEGFSEDMRNAFILLARSRYFCPQLNHIVTEDIAKTAAVVVQQSTKQVSSVKILQFEIIETEYPPYEHLGLEKGGQAIQEAKKAWLELLKRIILMMQLRSSFLMVEVANKNATKKMNVLKKIVIPRTNVTIGYIHTELEEMAREEFHRLKKIKQKKKKDRDSKEKKSEPIQPCRMCIESVTPVKSDIFKYKDETEMVTSNEKEIKELYTSSESFHSATKPSTCESNGLDYLKSLVNDLIVSGKDLLQSSIEKIDVNDFINTCEITKLKIDEFFKLYEQSFGSMDENLEQKLTHLQVHLNIVIDIIEEFQPEITVSPSVENFVRVIQVVRQRLNNYLQTISAKEEHGIKKELDELRDIINDIKNLITEYKKQGVLSHDADDFIKSCNSMNLRLEKRFQIENNISYRKSELNLHQSFKCVDSYKTRNDNFDRKLEHLKYHLHKVIEIIKEIKPALKLPFNVESFASICREIVEKLNIIYKESKSNVHESLECVESCINKVDSKIFQQENSNQPIFDEKAICDTCSNTFDLKKPSNESICVTCSNSVSEQQDKPTTPITLTEPLSSCNLCKLIAKQYQKTNKESITRIEKDIKKEPASACDLCKLLAKEKENERGKINRGSETKSETSLIKICRPSLEILSRTSGNEENDAGIKENLGYYEMIRYKKVKVTTRQNANGTVWEEKETITMNKVKRDPTITSLPSDDDDTFDEHLDEGSAKHVNLCTVPSNSHGFSQFVKTTQSEVGVKIPPLADLRLRQCVSLDNVFFF